MKKNDKVTSQVKEIFTSLSSEHKQEARERLSKNFNVSIAVVNNHWMYKGEIPPAYLIDVLQILKEVGKQQITTLKKIIA